MSCFIRKNIPAEARNHNTLWLLPASYTADLIFTHFSGILKTQHNLRIQLLWSGGTDFRGESW